MGYTGVKTYRTFGDPSFATKGPAVYGQTILAFQWVYMPDGATSIFIGDVRDPVKRYTGLVLYDGLVGEEAVMVFGGEVEITAGGLSPGQVYYAHPSTPGAITKTRPPGEYQVVGIAVTEFRFLVAIQDFVSIFDSLPYYNSDKEAFDAGFEVYKSSTAHESLPYGVKKEVDPRTI